MLSPLTSSVADETALVDGTTVSHPSQGVYLKGAGMSLENRGVQPDYEVVKCPGDYREGVDDPQLAKAIEVATAMLQKQRPVDVPPENGCPVWASPV